MTETTFQVVPTSLKLIQDDTQHTTMCYVGTIINDILFIYCIQVFFSYEGTIWHHTVLIDFDRYYHSRVEFWEIAN